MADNPHVLGHLMAGRQNNFDFIRFVAASLVIYSHSFALSLGHEDTETLMLLSDGQSTFGHLALMIFFISSGFLITQSFDRSKDLVYFLRARILRIFPALIVVIFLTIFVLGPIVTELSILEYFKDSETYHYIWSLLLWPMQYDLPGVFESNTYPNAVNGSLWTLYHEFVSYLIVCLLGVAGLLYRKKFIVSLFIITYIFSFFSFPRLDQILNIELFCGFAAGGMFYLYRDKFPMNGKWAILSAAVLLVTMFTNFFIEAFTLFGGYLLLYLAYTPKINLHNFGKHGDFSYGIYIYGFPIQQTITYYMGGEMNQYLNFLLSYPLIMIFAVASWKLVEKNALKLKGSGRRKVPAVHAEARSS